VKQIIAIVQVDRLEDLRECLLEAGIGGLTVTRVLGRGGGSGSCLRDFMESRRNQPLTEMSRLEILADDDQLDTLLDCIMSSLNQSKVVSNGKIFVCDPQSIIRVRTGERGSCAIS